MSKGGKQTTGIEIPSWLEDPVKRNLARGEQAAGIGYMPYYGPDVAALNPSQLAAMSNANSAAGAFGLQAPTGAGTGLPPPQTFAGGVQGYSSGDLFDQAVQEFERRRPEQAERYNALFDPKAMINNPQQWNAVSSAGFDPMSSGGMSGMTDAQFIAQMGQGASNALAMGQSGLLPMSWAKALAADAYGRAGINPYGQQAPAPVRNANGVSGGGYGSADFGSPSGGGWGADVGAGGE